MATIRDLIHQFDDKLETYEIPLETARVFMLELCQQNQIDMYQEYERPVPEQLRQLFCAGMEEVLTHKPLAQILGYSWFYGYQFSINEDVLIPRPETEELVAQILMATDTWFADVPVIEAVDIGTGSGAIAIALVKEEPKFRMIATDISEAALVIARDNAKQLEAEVTFIQGDMAQPLIDRNIKVDVLICNPPYIPQAEEVELSVKDFEPHVALFGGEDGIKFYRQIFTAAPQVLKEKAMMAFEIGYQQKEILLQEVHKTFGEVRAEVLSDINGKDRMLFVYFNC